MIQKTGKQIDQENFTRAILEPREVSGFLEIDGSALPRLAANTIGEPTEPSSKRGKASAYSPLDAVLISLGQGLLELGMSVHGTRSCLIDARKWIISIMQHPDFGKEKSEVMDMLKLTFLVARKQGAEFRAEFVHAEQLIEYLIGPEGAGFLTMLRMDKFMAMTLNRLQKQLDGV
jgi:hypothetical protein